MGLNKKLMHTRTLGFSDNERLDSDLKSYNKFIFSPDIVRTNYS